VDYDVWYDSMYLTSPCTLNLPYTTVAQFSIISVGLLGLAVCVANSGTAVHTASRVYRHSELKSTWEIWGALRMPLAAVTVTFVYAKLVMSTSENEIKLT